MTRFEVAMVGSTHTQIIQVEDLLRSFGETLVPQEEDDVVETRANALDSKGFDSRPLVAAFLAFFVFAPGCAAAAVFLMRADGNIPPIATPDSNPPFVSKSDRLPLGQWSLEAAESTGPKDEARLAVAAALADPSFLQPIMIRGSIEDGTITSFSDAPTAPNAFASMDKPSSERASTERPWTEKPRPRRAASRVKPPKLVAAVAPPEPPQQSFFEKLFGPRVN